LAIDKRLAAASAASAEAQRNVWSTLWRLANLEGSGVNWAQVAARLQAMKDAGTLFPADERFLLEARKKAGLG
jgi:hypothetical protein